MRAEGSQLNARTRERANARTKFATNFAILCKYRDRSGQPDLRAAPRRRDLRRCLLESQQLNLSPNFAVTCIVGRRGRPPDRGVGENTAQPEDLFAKIEANAGALTQQP